MEKIFKELYNHSPSFQKEIGRLNRATGKNALIIWQYVRLNPKYRKSYAAAVAEANTRSEDYAPDIFSELGQQWGLYPYAVDPDEVMLDEDFYFEVKANVKSFKIHVLIEKKKNRDKFWHDLNIYHSQNEEIHSTKILISLNPMADKISILKEIEKLTEKMKKEFVTKINNVPDVKSPILKGRGTSNLIENLCIYYITKKLKLKSSEAIKEKMTDLLDIKRGQPYQAQHIKRMAARFEKVSSVSPWCFFLKPN